MKIDLIGMILNTSGRRHFDGVITDDNGKELDALHSLDFMIMEYAKVRNGGESSSVAVPISLKEPSTPNPEWRTCTNCKSPEFCTNKLRGCDIAESLESGIEPISVALNPLASN